MDEKKHHINKNQPFKQRLQSQDLFAHTRVIVIEHQGDEYYLRLTSNGKLILTKG